MAAQRTDMTDHSAARQLSGRATATGMWSKETSEVHASAAVKVIPAASQRGEFVRMNRV